MSNCKQCSRSCARRAGIDPTCLPTIALAGNPNTGKTTLFNRLTGLRQHTGNWPGKTVVRAEGTVEIAAEQYRVIDLPGTYTLLAASAEERVARDFIVFGQPDVTIVVADATALERNLSLALQVMEITHRVVLCVNLIDEARRKGLSVDTDKLSQALGIPVVGTSARSGRGVTELLTTVAQVAKSKTMPHPRLICYDTDIEAAVAELLPTIETAVGSAVNPRWLALRLIEQDRSVLESINEYLGQIHLPNIAIAEELP